MINTLGHPCGLPCSTDVTAPSPTVHWDRRQACCTSSVPRMMKLVPRRVHGTSGCLDPDLSLEVMRIFRRFNEVGVTLLIASHDISLIDRLGCRRIPLANGRIEEFDDEHAGEDDLFVSEPQSDESWR